MTGHGVILQVLGLLSEQGTDALRILLNAAMLFGGLSRDFRTSAPRDQP
jgi:hypothetical protein